MQRGALRCVAHMGVLTPRTGPVAICVFERGQPRRVKEKARTLSKKKLPGRQTLRRWGSDLRGPYSLDVPNAVMFRALNDFHCKLWVSLPATRHN